MDLLEKADKWLASALEWILVGLFAVFLTLTCILVFLRYLFSESILGADQIVTIAFIFACAIGGAVGISKREHIAITFFIDMLPRSAKRIVYVAGLGLVAVINGWLIYLSIDWISRAGHNPWQPFNMPQGLIHAAIPIGCSLAVLFCVIKIVLTIAGRESVDVLWMPED